MRLSDRDRARRPEAASTRGGDGRDHAGVAEPVADGWYDDGDGPSAGSDADPPDDPGCAEPVAFAEVIAAVRGLRAAEPADPHLDAWIGAIVERDERALAALYDATFGRVYGLVLRIVGRRELAEEVVEDTFFQVWREAPRFDPSRGRALAWLLGMARSRAIDASRRETRFMRGRVDPGDVPPTPDDAPVGDELLAVARSHAALHRALQLIDPQPRQLVALAFFRGLSHEEIAVQTSLPLGTVKSQIRRALATLRRVLGDDSPAPQAG